MVKSNVNWYNILCGLGVVSVIAVLIYFTLLRSSPKKSGSSSSSSSSSGFGSYFVNPNKVNSSSVSNCFVPENQKFNCAHLTGDDNHQDQFRCLPWRSDMLNQGGCDELYSVFQEGGECSQESKDVYDQKCSNNDPVIHNYDRNHIKCGQDCSDPNIAMCYTNFLNSQNQKCEFGSSNNSGSLLSNCRNYGEIQGLLCNTALTKACQNVLTNATHCK